MSKSPVMSMSARKRGTTRFLTGSTPSTCSASSSSRIFRAPRSAVIAVPATPATTTAVTVGANSRIEASTKKPPRRSSAPNSERKFAACRPGAPNPNASVEIIIGNQQSWRAKRNCPMNSPPYGYGGRIAETTVFAVRIIMSPTCSNRDLAGRNALSATDLTMALLRSHPQAGPRPRTHHRPAYPAASPKPPPNQRRINAWRRLCDAAAVRHRQPSGGQETPELPIPRRNAGGRVRGMLPAPLEESSSTARPRRVRQRLGIGLLITLSAVAVSACGGGERQDADEPEGEFPVQIVSADFPSGQQLAQNTDLTLAVENSGERTIPDLAITIFTSSNTSTGKSGDTGNLPTAGLLLGAVSAA